MTTACAALGGVPMILFSGTGSEFRRPLGYAIVGGLIVSQALTLFTTPVVYIYLDRVRERFAKKKADPEGTPRVEDGGQPVAEPS
jgi:Cu/Ag efflux pump CusA